MSELKAFRWAEADRIGVDAPECSLGWPWRTAVLEQPFTVNFRTSFSPEAVTFVFAGLGIVGADTYSAKVRSSRDRDGRCEKRSARDSIDNGLTPDVEEGKNPFCIPSFPRNNRDV